MADTGFGNAPDSLYTRPTPETPLLGRYITLTIAVILATVGIVAASHWPGTIWPAIPTGAGIGLAARLAYVMTFKEKP